MQGCTAEQIAAVKRKKVDGGPVLPIDRPAVDVNWVPCVSCKTFIRVERNYRWYCGIMDDDPGQLADVSSDMVDDFDDVFTQEAV